MTISCLVQLMAIMCAVMLTSGAYASSNTGLLRTIRSYDRTRTCTRNTPCIWALCVWSQYVTVDPENCMFISSGCRCARGQRCRRTLDVTPDNGYLTVPFTCQ